MDRFSFWAFLFFKNLFRITPFWAIYCLSDLVFLLIYYVFRYRKTVVINNLKKAFPEKLEKEIATLSYKFYRNFADILVEGIKGISLSEKEIVKRYKFINQELAEKHYHDGRNIMIVGSHYANWEWGVLAGAPQIIHHCIGMYKPLSNKLIDDHFKKNRAQLGMNLEAIKNTKKAFSNKYDKPTCFILLADQSPSNMKRAIWLDFLGIDTACLHGPEYYSKQYNMPVLYVDVQRIKRGFYEVRYIPIIDEPDNTESGEITKIYMNTLEKIIRLKPEHWLWSHRRWKRKR
jgi:KDO2-lipid IV(A) lauroyltransferase